MKRRHYTMFLSAVLATALLIHFGHARDALAFVIGSFWNDGDNIVMDDVFLPADVWSSPAQFQLSEWNEVDTTDNSHPFRINNSPQFSFGSNDGDNTMGYLGESGLMSEYGLDYSMALAWAVCFGGTPIDECDVMLDPTLPWQLVPDDDEFFQSTVLHETGHVRGLQHYNNYHSMQNSGQNKKLRDEVLYMDDKEAVRQNASSVNENDITIYRKWHDGAAPQWMTVSPTTARVGGTVNFNNITVENRGTNAFGALRFGIYFSTNDIISTGDQLLNTGSFGSFGRFTFSTFNWSATVPFVSDCSTRFFGAVIDDNNATAERFEGNNDVAFSNGVPEPQAFNILLERDGLEPNDSFFAPRSVSLPFSNSNLTIDQDLGSDFYRFTLTQLSRVTISTSFTHSSGDVDLDLRNSANTILASSTSSSNGESIVRDLAAGTYYIRSYGFNTGSCNRYSINASSIILIPDITVTPVSGAFANVALGDTRDRTLVIGNSGNGPLNVTATSLSGADSAQFSIVSGGGAFTLAPGVTRNVIVRFTPASLGAKTATLVLATNDPDENPKNVPLNGTATTPPDLVVSILTGATTAGAGATVTITDTTANQGTGPALGSTTRFHLSPDGILSPGDPAIGSRAVPALAAGATNSVSTMVTIPAGTANGDYFIIAVADAPGAVFESNESNNRRARFVKVGPDVSVTVITAPVNGGAGKTLSVSTTTWNLPGSSPAGASTTSIYLSTNAVFDAGDTLLGSRAIPALAAGASNTGAVSVTIPGSTANGDYFLIGRADANAVLPETLEGNNNKAKSIKIGPDLTVTVVTAPASAAKGASISVGDTTRNDGPGDAGASMTRFYLSTDSLFGAGDVLLGARAVPAIVAGAANTGSRSVTIPAGTASGNHFIIAVADGPAVITEVRELNNTKVKFINITP